MKGRRSSQRIFPSKLLWREGILERDRAHLANLYRMLSQANQAMLRATNEAELFQDICQICVEHGPFGLAWVAVLKDGQLCTAAAAGPMQGFLEGLQVSPDPADPLGQGPTGRAFRGERSVVCEGWATEPSLEPWWERGARFGFLAGGSFPVRTQQGVSAVLTLYANRVGQFQPDRIDLLEELTKDMAFALDKFQLERQKQEAEAGLAASLSHWNATFDAMEEAVCLLNLQGQILQANAAFTRRFGPSQAAVLDHRCHEIHHGTLGFLDGCPFQAMVNSGTRESVEICVQDRWLEVVADPLRDPQGLLIGAVHVLRDITAQKQAGDQISQERKFYRNLINAQPAGVYQILFAPHTPPPASHWMADLQGHYQVQFVSDQFCQILGINREAFTANPSSLSARFLPEDGTRFRETRAQAVREKRGFQWEGRIGTGANLRWVRFESYPRLLEEGTTLWTGVIADITDRKQVEAVLQEEQRVFQDLVTALPAGIYRLRVHPTPAMTADEWESVHVSSYQVEFASDRFCAMAGLSREAFQADPGLLLAQIHPEDRAEFSARNAEALNQMLPFRWEGRLLGAEPPHWVRFESSPRPLPDGGSVWTGVLTDITDRRKKHDDFRRLHNLLRQAEAIAKVSGWEVDLETQSLYWTEQTYTLHDLEPGAYVPTLETAIQFYAPEWRPIITLAVQEAIESGRSFDLELELITAKGRRIWIHTTGQPVQREGKVVKVLGAIQDITAQKRADEALQQSESENRALIRAIPDLIFTNHRNGEYLAVHAMDPALLLVPPQAFLHRNIQDVLPQPIAAQFTKAFADALDQHAVQEWQYALPVGGETKQFEARVARCTDDTVLTIVRDITARVDAERAQRESERQFRSILDNMQDVYFRADLAGRFLHISPSAPDLYGYDSVEEMLGVTPTELYLRPEMRQELMDLLKGGIGVHDWIGEGRRKDGSGFWASMNVQYVRNEQGLVIGTEGVVRDITARKHAERKIQEQLEELQRWQGVMLNREDRVQQLKREVNDLAQRLGESVRYASQADSTAAASEAPKP